MKKEMKCVTYMYLFLMMDVIAMYCKHVPKQNKAIFPGDIGKDRLSVSVYS